jgi:hypothetical protein
MRLQISDGGFQIGARFTSARFTSARFRSAWTFIAAWVLVGALGAAALRAETIDRVLAVVANQLITLSDVTAAIDLGLQRSDGAADPVRAVLTKLIDRELVLAEVDRYAPAEPTAEQVDREVQAVRQRFPEPAAFEAALARSGIDERHLRETLRQDLRMRAYLDQRFSTIRDRRPSAVDEWMTGLRQRGGVVDLYLAGR